MRRKEVLFAAVIGGVVGAVLTMAAGSFSPLGAQNEVRDAEFRKITCTGLRVEGADGARAVTLGAVGNGGSFFVFGKDGEIGVGMTVNEDGGYVRVYDKNLESGVSMSVDEHGGYVRVDGKDVEILKGVRLSVDERGGRVYVYGRDGEYNELTPK